MSHRPRIVLIDGSPIARCGCGWEEANGELLDVLLAAQGHRLSEIEPGEESWVCDLSDAIAGIVSGTARANELPVERVEVLHDHPSEIPPDEPMRITILLHLGIEP